VPWLWRTASNPSAGAKIIDVYGDSPTSSFSLYGILISQNSTSTKTYTVRTRKTSTNEVCTFMKLAVPPGTLIIQAPEDDTVIAGIGAYAGEEHLEILTDGGGEPSLTIGILVRGFWNFATGYEMYG